MPSLVVGLVLAGAAGPAHAAGATEIHRCAQPDGTVVFQDRPCAATPPAASSQPPATPEARPQPRAEPAAPTPALPSTRSEYLALNESRCAAGDRRACIAVECERSGSLGSRECQAALGHQAGEGWRVRPVDDVLEPGRAADRHRLTCTGTPRTVEFLVARENAGARQPSAVPAAALERERVPAFAREFCAGAQDSTAD